MDTPSPKLIIGFSGKRKSGKDYITSKLVETLGERCTVITLSKPIKSHFAALYSMNLTEMMSSSAYKEQRRQEMVKWGEDQRAQNPFVFCESIAKEAEGSGKEIWIVSDLRRRTDVKYFEKYCQDNGIQLKLIRVNCDEETRGERGWVFTEGIDDAETECDLDPFNSWDVVVDNSKNDNLELQFKELCDSIHSVVGAQ